MTCLTDVPLAPSAQVVVAAARPESAKAVNAAGASAAARVAGAFPAGTVSTPRTRVPPPTVASSPVDHRARRAAEVFRRARPAGPLVSLVAAMGDYLHLHRATEPAGQHEDKSGRISAGGTTRRRSGAAPARGQRPATAEPRNDIDIAA